MIKKTTWSLLAILLSVLLSCCDNNDDDVVMTFDTTLFPGQWCYLSDYGDAMVINMEYNHSYKGFSYTFNEGFVYEESVTGSWIYYATNSSIVMTALNSNHINTTTSYAVKELSPNKMVLQNKDLGSVETYYPMASETKISIGEKFYVDNGEISFISNENVLKLDESLGQVIAIGSGTCFVLIGIESEFYIQKITVDHLINEYINTISFNIDHVLEKYSTPDVTGSVGPLKAILYNSNLPYGLKSVQFNFDETSNEITKVTVRFENSEIYESQKQYIATTHFYDESMDVYHNLPDLFSSDYMILANVNSDGTLYITITNLPYLLNNGYC